jgi:hypothetical protein
MRVAAINWCTEIPGLAVYLFRRIESDLFKNHIEGPHGFPMLLADWINAKLVRITEDKIRFRFNGSVIHLCHCNDEEARFKYLGAEIHVLLIDELTTFTETIYRFLRSRLRAPGIELPEHYRICSHCGGSQRAHEEHAPETCGGYRALFPRIICGSNPGGLGHLWVKRTFVDGGAWHVKKTSDDEGGLMRQFVPAKIADNPTLMRDEPDYNLRLRGLGNKELVKAMELGDWNVVAGAYFDNWSTERHVIKPFAVPRHWTRIRSFDWGSRSPFCCLWWAISDGQPLPDGRWYPAGSMICYREWYGVKKDSDGLTIDNVGLSLENTRIAHGIKLREAEGEVIKDSVADPSMWNFQGGPTIAEQFMTAKGAEIMFRKADNNRRAGWAQMKSRMTGTDFAMIYWFDTCIHCLRTIPVLQGDQHDPEDLNTAGEDHCFGADTLVRTSEGSYSFAELIGRRGHVRSHDGEWHPFRSVRLVKCDQPVVLLRFSDGSTIRCTPDHKILTTAGWMEARDLLGQTILSLSHPPSRNSRASDITFAANIFAARVACSIARYGSPIAARYRRIGTFITSRIALRTASMIWRRCPNLIIDGSMGQRTLYGISRQRAEHGIASTIQRLVKLSIGASPEFASNAAPVSKAYITSVFARTLARPRGDALPVPMMRTASVRYAQGASASIVTRKSRPAPENAAASPALAPGPMCLDVRDAGRADVYCLTVPDTGNFELANGAIVANCADSVRYACMARPIITRPTLELPMRGIQQLTMGELWRDHDQRLKEREL